MARADGLRNFKTSKELDYSEPEQPERALLRGILSRAIYDLTPEANHESRRDAIAWFRRKPKDDISDEAVTSFQRVKWELSLGSRILRLIEETLKDAEAFDQYIVTSRLNNIQVDIEEWVKGRRFYRALNKKPGMPAIRYRKSSYAEVEQ